MPGPWWLYGTKYLSRMMVRYRPTSGNPPSFANHIPSREGAPGTERRRTSCNYVFLAVRPKRLLTRRCQNRTEVERDCWRSGGGKPVRPGNSIHGFLYAASPHRQGQKSHLVEPRIPAARRVYTQRLHSNSDSTVHRSRGDHQGKERVHLIS